MLNPKIEPDMPEEKITSLPEYQAYMSVHPAFSFNQGANPRKTPLARKHTLEARMLDTDTRVTPKKIEAAIAIVKVSTVSKVKQITGNTIWATKITEQVENGENWKAVPRTIVKTVQDVLTHPVDRISFIRDELEIEGGIDEALRAIIIDTRLITNTLLTNLGLEEYLPEKGVGRVAAHETREQAVDAIREMFANVKPITFTENNIPGSESDFRMYEITAGKNKGKILISQNREKGNKVLALHDVYSAERRQLHALKDQNEEKKLLREIHKTLSEVETRLRENSKKPITSDEIEDKKKKLLEDINTIKNVKAFEKRRLKDQITKALRLRYEPSRKLNKGAMRACISTAKEAIERRGQNVESMGGHEQKDAERLQAIIRVEEDVTKSFLEKVERNDEKLRILHADQKELTPNEVVKIKESLTSMFDETNKMEHQPNLMFAEKYRVYITNCIAGLDAYDPKNTEGTAALQKNFICLYSVAKIHRAMMDLKKLEKTMAIEQDTYSPADTIAELRKIGMQMKRQRIAKDKPVNDMRDTYIEIYGYLISLLEEANKNLNGTDPSNGDLIDIKKVRKLLAHKIAGIPMLKEKHAELMRKVKDGETPSQPFQIDKVGSAEKMKVLLESFDWEKIVAEL